MSAPKRWRVSQSIWQRGKGIDIIRTMTQYTHNPTKLPLDLNPAEEKLVNCVEKGVSCKVGNGELPDPGSPIISGDAANLIREEVIRFLAYNGPVLGGMIDLRGALIAGNLNLSNANIPFALVFAHCHFDFNVHMLHMECHGLYMNGCHLAQGLNGYGMKTKGGVFLRRFRNKYGQQTPFSAKGEVQLVGAHIGGDLDCRGGKFDNSNPEENALDADRITVKGNVLLSDGFSAKGEVRLLAADIRGQLDCAGGLFANKGDSKYALNAERVKVGGHVYLNQHESGGKEPFTAAGRVRFANANIGGNFNCKGGQFNHSGKRSALAAGGLKSGAVFLSEKFSAKGEVALHVAHIGNFVCTGCNQNDKSPTTIRLSSTKAAAVDDAEDDNKKPWKPFQFILDGFTYDTFYGRSPTKSKLRLEWLAKRPRQIPLKNGKMANLPFSPLPYEQAAKVLFGMGHGSDARKILLEKERRQTDDERTPWWHKIWRGLWGEFAGYGYQWEWTILWSLAIILIGWFVFSHTNDMGCIVPHQPAIIASEEFRNMSPNVPPEYPEFNPLVFSADVFIPVFALHQEPFWYPAAGSESVSAWLFKGQEIIGWTIGGIIIVIFLLVAFAEEFLLGFGESRVRWGNKITRYGCPLVVRAATIYCLYALGMESPKHWYWLEIGFGWLLTSLFLLSVTGLLRPRQSSGGKD